MAVAELIARLRTHGITLRLEGERLRVNAPAGTLTPALQDEIRRHKPALVAFIRNATSGADAAPPIPRVDRTDGAPLGLVQQRMWLLDRLEPGTTVYNLPGAWRLRGSLDVEAFRRALATVTQRHEVMRACIDWRGDTPVQRIAETVPVDLPLVDLTGETDATVREADLMRRMEAERDRLFALDTPPLFRACLYRLAPGEHVFLFIPHHVIWDGWSWDILLGELSAIYQAFVRGEPDPLPALDVQYADVAAWHRQWMQGAELERQAAYWRDRLAGPLPVLDLPTDHPRPRIMSQRGIRRVLDLDERVLAALRDLARGESATVFMGLLAAYTVLLHRYTGQHDIVVGAPIQDRLHPDAQHLIGVFVNTLVLRTGLTPAATFREVLREARDVCIGAYAHQDVPFEHIVEELQPERSLSHTPLFQTLFTFQDITNRPATLGDLELTQVHVPTHDAPTDVLLGIMVGRDRTIGVFDFNADLFAPATMERFVTGFTTLLADIVARPDTPIGSLTVLPPAERTRVVEAFNDTARPIPDVTVADLVARQVAASPGAAAVRAAEDAWTYEELDHRANAIAVALAGAGVAPGDLVALCLERSADIVAAILGVWRAGGAWVPLDPEYPEERTRWVLDHSGARIVLGRGGTAAAVPPHDGVTLDLDTVPAQAAPPALPSVAGDDLAYVLYTSGSTGQPKGVAIRHRSVVNFLEAMRETPGCGPDDRLLAVTTLAFDIAVLELLLPLTVGAEVIVCDAATARDGATLADLVTSVQPTLMQATPSTWRMMLDAGWAGSPALRVLCGGEALPAALADDLVGRVRELWNMYGPTETTVWSTCGRVRPDDDRITVGRPIANTRVYVLDADQHPVPVGIPGEAWIGGAGVTAGYLHDPERTAERVWEDPVVAGGGPVYRTGDLVRWLDDGRLEHLGRLDRQLKVHGHRIEPGEIEAALDAQPEISQSVVAARDHDADRRLVAYLVFADGKRMTSTEVRRRLGTRLPPYMVPGLIVPLTSLPLTPNGKVDQAALPDPMARASAATRRSEPPATDLERSVAAIWTDVLGGGAAVGRHDNFFELGGHSLQSIRAVALMGERLGLDVDPRVFFFQTLAQIVEGATQDAARASAAS